jgi:predicted RNA binding protein YcfA (HicA-like mRNA interferase family)
MLVEDNMGHYEKLMIKILSGTHDNNIMFSDLQKILDRLGFKYRVKGDHFIYTKSDVAEIINIQPINGKAKGYQVQQIRGIIVKYQLGGDINEV